MTGRRVVQVMERLKWTHGLPSVIHCDNGSEFISKAMDDWAHRNGVKLDFSRPARPTDNPFIESFNGKLREECLRQHWFQSIEEAKAIIEEWRKEYNEQRPHRSLQGQTPEEFEEQWRREKALQRAA